VGKIGAVAGLVGIVIVAAALVGPWWTFSASITVIGFESDVDAEFGLFGGVARLTTPAGSSTETLNYSESPNIGAVFTSGMVFTVLAVGFGVLMVVLSAMSGARPRLGRAAALMGVLAFALALAGPMYVMNALPAAVNADTGGGATTGYTLEGFSGAESTTVLGNTVSVAYGGGWGWYLPLAGAFVLLVGAVASLRAPRASAALPPPPGYAPPP